MVPRTFLPPRTITLPPKCAFSIFHTDCQKPVTGYGEIVKDALPAVFPFFIKTKFYLAYYTIGAIMKNDSQKEGRMGNEKH